MKLFRLARFHSGAPNINLEVDNDFIKTRLASLGFSIQEGEDGRFESNVSVISWKDWGWMNWVEQNS
jgi:hypothetical protein